MLLYHCDSIPQLRQVVKQLKRLEDDQHIFSNLANMIWQQICIGTGNDLLAQLTPPPSSFSYGCADEEDSEVSDYGDKESKEQFDKGDPEEPEVAEDVGILCAKSFEEDEVSSHRSVSQKRKKRSQKRSCASTR
ncbi:uncharacterized protein LOC136037698 isoform X2 [Artemia franciscana]|uniref:uncharacterized protein LOC136037698 isoform X2 n=1 Tax=Artemia franciscana TaxID=6661 RepID=UPI0032D9B033